MKSPPSQDGLRLTMLQGLAWTSLDRWGNRLLSLAMVALLARLLDRTDFGLVAAAAVWVDYFATYVGQGLGFAIVQRKDLEGEHLNAAFWISLGFAGALFLLTWVMAPYLAGWMGYPSVRPVLRWLSLGLILQALNRVQMALLTRNMRFAPIAAVNVVSSVAGAIVGLSLALLGWGVWSLVAQQLVAGAAARIALWWIVDWQPGIRFSMRHVRDLYSYSLYVFIDQQVLFVSRRLDEALVAAFLGVADLGLYSIAKRLVLVLQEVLETPLAQVLFPAFSRLQASLPRLTEAAEKSYRLACFLVLPAFAGLIALAPEAVRLLFGATWVDAVPLVRILAVGAPFFLFPLTTHAVFHALGRPGVALLLNSVRATVGITVLPLGALFGILGIPAALSTRNLLGTFGDIFLLRRSFGAVRIRFISGFFRPLLASTLTGILTRVVADWVIHAGLILRVVAASFAGLSFYVLLMLFLDRPLLTEFFKITCETLQPMLSRVGNLRLFSAKT